jgi:lipoprotein NlpI/Zn-dependent protease
MVTLTLSVAIVMALLALLGASLPRLYGATLDAAIRELGARDYDRAAHLATRALGIVRFTQVGPEAAHCVRGVAFLLLGKYDLAGIELDEAVRLKPDWADAHAKRGALLTARRRLDEAVADQRTALELDPNNVEAHLGRGRALCLQGRYEEALIDCASAIRLRPDDARAQRGIGILQFCAGRFDDAAASLSRSARLDPYDAYAVLWLHLARARAGEDDARDYRESARRLNHRAWPAPLVALELGELGVAEVLAAATAGDAGTHRGRLCEAAFFRGEQALLRGETGEAEALLREALEKGPGHFVEQVAAEIELQRLSAPETAVPRPPLLEDAPPLPRAPSRGSVPIVPLAPGGYRPSPRGMGAWLAAAGVAQMKLVKSAKFIKFGLFIASLGALALNRPFEAACAIVYAIFVHESGHVLAMKACGMPTSGMYFLPFLGAVAVGKERARTRGQEWFIAIAGPAFGLLSILPLVALGWLTGSKEWLLYAALAALINLFNLLPIGVLDGGRIVQAIAFSIAGWLGIAVFALGLAGGAYVLWWTAGGALSIIMLLSIVEFVGSWRRHKSDPIPHMRGPAVVGATLAYLGLFVLFGFAVEFLGGIAQTLGS